MAYTSSHCAKYVAASFAANVLKTLLMLVHIYQVAAIFLDFVVNEAHVICTNLVQLPVRVASPVPSFVYLCIDVCNPCPASSIVLPQYVMQQQDAVLDTLNVHSTAFNVQCMHAQLHIIPWPYYIVLMLMHILYSTGAVQFSLTSL